MNAALAAALLGACASQTRTGCARLVLSSAASLRSRYEPPVGPDHFGCHMMMMESEHEVTQYLPFWELARSCGRTLRSTLAAKGRLGFVPPRFSVSSLAALVSHRLSQAEEEQCFPGGAALSNLGALDMPVSYGPLRLEGLCFNTAQVAGLYLLFLSVLTLSGEPQCCLSYTEPLLGAETARAIAQDLVSRLSAASS